MLVLRTDGDGAVFHYGDESGCWARMCKYGDAEAHKCLESDPGVGGTRVLGVDENGQTIWQHREVELRCRVCNRRRVAAHRAKRKAVIGNAVSPITAVRA
jgi:hypothetical protein